MGASCIAPAILVNIKTRLNKGTGKNTNLICTAICEETCLLHVA